MKRWREGERYEEMEGGREGERVGGRAGEKQRGREARRERGRGSHDCFCFLYLYMYLLSLIDPLINTFRIRNFHSMTSKSFQIAF